MKLLGLIIVIFVGLGLYYGVTFDNIKYKVGVDDLRGVHVHTQGVK